jgi:MinD-like ATPase involved in chromosome partitioning or flagellar assembly
VTVVGVTAVSPACKRGLAANLASFCALHEGTEIVAVDCDPVSADLGPRLAVEGPTLDRVAALSGGVAPSALMAVLGRALYPPVRVLPVTEGVCLTPESAERSASVLRRLAGRATTLVVDLPAAPPGDREAALALGVLLEPVEHVIVAVTPDPAVVDAAHALVRRLQSEGRGRRTVSVAVTGDEGSECLDPDACALTFEAFGVTVVHQWWGRSAPNFGFGPTLGLAESDRALGILAQSCAALDRALVV